MGLERSEVDYWFEKRSVLRLDTQSCAEYVGDWMACNRLEMNDDKRDPARGN